MISNFRLNSKKYLCKVNNSIIEENITPRRLKGLILLNRSNACTVTANIIPMQSTRKLLILKNIVRIQYFPYEFRKKLNQNVLLQALSNLKVFSLSIPNGIDKLNILKDEYVNFFDSIEAKT